MSEAELRLECVRLAASFGELDLAQKIYEFVTSPPPERERTDAQRQ